MSAAKPRQRNLDGPIRFVSLLELIDPDPGMNERRSQATICAHDMHGGWRGIQDSIKPRIWFVWGNDRRQQRGEQSDRQYTATHGRPDVDEGSLHSLILGLTNTAAASDTSVPTARNIDPAAAHPATRYVSRARSA